ncbi:hypothetical protein HPT25_17565 [Bacillus sp. BRMEA1]|uniref:hypothetical protein n=1 Tax=Neobacillus endophyticus TaxID=2738405 RepID=UPI00156548DD|nr:hypothetical protein [Neobacillus endophyticus]NRD79169.1 hypothetical protein [Neobacillus endophyticus]
MANDVSIPRPPDVVTILWERNPLDRQAPRTIVEASVIGSADGCSRFLRTGRRYTSARNCLLDNGFEQILSESFGVFGVSVFVRFS